MVIGKKKAAVLIFSHVSAENNQFDEDIKIWQRHKARFHPI